VGTARQRERETERVGAGEKNGADSLARQSSKREREREGERARVCVDRRGPPVRHQGRVGAGVRAGVGLIGLVWAEIGFPFSRDFLIAFLFNFSSVFNSNSNQVSNSNQIKSMPQFKEYLGSI
jgi:hypothetical protein